MNVSISKKSKFSKRFVIIDDKLGKPWANESFDSVEEAMRFIKQNNLTLNNGK